MTLQFFADHCVSNYIIKEIGKIGFEVFRLRDHLPTNSNDTLVILKAQELETILISLNGDFANIITYPPEQFRGIICLQIKNHPEITVNIVSILKAYLLKNRNMLHYKGKLFIVEAHRIRLKE